MHQNETLFGNTMYILKIARLLYTGILDDFTSKQAISILQAVSVNNCNYINFNKYWNLIIIRIIIIIVIIITADTVVATANQS